MSKGGYRNGRVDGDINDRVSGEKKMMGKVWTGLLWCVECVSVTFGLSSLSLSLQDEAYT